MKAFFRNILVPVIVLNFSFTVLNAQNIAITDDDGYTANPSAMLDVKSVSKGLLIPRLTTTQRTMISNPAAGLLVFDTDEDNFCFHNGTTWISLTSETNGIWTKEGNNVFVTDTLNKIGVGTNSPYGKLEVKGDIPVSSTEPLFEVLNSNGDTVFAVYSQGVRVYILDDPAIKASGNRGGFAVGGFSQVKGFTDEYLRVTPDSVRIYIKDSIENKATGNRGGFAVGGFSHVKNITDDYLFVDTDSTRVWTSGVGGFEVKDLASNSSNYMDLNPDNYFIGHESGKDNLSGMYNSFLGFHAGEHNESGNSNVYLGYHTGLSNVSGSNNVNIGHGAGEYSGNVDGTVIIGEGAGSNNSGSYNTIIGHNSGHHISGSYNVVTGTFSGTQISGTENAVYGFYAGTYINSGNRNSFYGSQSGNSTSSGSSNSFFGYSAGNNNTSGVNNTYLGASSGWYASGSDNVFLGYCAGAYEYGSNKLYIENSIVDKTQALIYGEFDNNIVRINEKLGVNIYPNTNLSVYNSNESPTLTSFTQAINNAGINIISDYTAGTFTPGIFWSDQNENSSKPKAGIWMYQDGNGTDLYLGTSNSYVTGITNAALLINEAGNVGINTFSPMNKLDVKGKISVTQSVGGEMVIINDDIWQHSSGNQDFGSGSGDFIIASKEALSETGGIHGDGDFITIWSPADNGRMVRFLDEDLFDGDGNPFNNGAEIAYIDNVGQYFQVSDMNRKQNMEKLPDALHKISSISGYSYEYKLSDKEVTKGDHPKTGYGVLAQELMTVMPDAVEQNEAGELFVNYNAVVPLLIEAIKEQQEMIANLQDEVNSLKSSGNH